MVLLRHLGEKMAERRHIQICLREQHYKHRQEPRGPLVAGHTAEGDRPGERQQAGFHRERPIERFGERQQSQASAQTTSVRSSGSWMDENATSGNASGESESGGENANVLLCGNRCECARSQLVCGKASSVWW
jgi:hypothetical protein